MKQKVLKILLLEDVADDAGLIVRALQNENVLFEIIRVDCKEKFLEEIKDFRPNVILADHSLPQFNSIEALKITLRERPGIPFILVTGTVSEEFAVTCLKEGADDYVLKHNLARLPAAIANALKQREYERYKKRTERALLKQNAKLAKVNSELDNFVYSVSHNLRSPLASILGLVNISRIDSKSNDSALSTYFNMIEECACKLDESLKEIADYSKNSHHQLAIEEVNLNSIINNCFEKLHFMDGFDKVERIVSVNQKAPLYSDEFRLSLVINNLISNAIIFRDEHKKHSFIHVSADVNKRNAILQIEDNGIGIAEDLQQKVFRMFFRASELSIGSGLGLYIARETTEKLSGKIQIQSHPGRGTKFLVKIRNVHE